MNAKEAVHHLVEARLQTIESSQGAAGILYRQGKTAAQRLQQQQHQQQQSGQKGLQSLQKQARHKGSIPSNKPSWLSTTAKSVARKTLSYHSPIGLGLTAGLDAVVPGLGVVSRAIQKTFGDSEIEEDTSQTQGGMLYGFHSGFWTVNSGPNQPTVSVPSHQVYGHDGVTKVVGKPGMKGKIVRTKKGPQFHTTGDGGPVSNPVGAGRFVVGVDY